MDKLWLNQKDGGWGGVGGGGKILAHGQEGSPQTLKPK